MTVGEFILRWYAIRHPKSIYLLLMRKIEFMPLHISAVAECTGSEFDVVVKKISDVSAHLESPFFVGREEKQQERRNNQKETAVK